MKDKKDIRLLFEKFVLGECSGKETEEVVAFFREQTPSGEIPSVEDILELLEERPGMEESKADAIYHKILEKGQKKDKVVPIRKKRFKKRYLTVAAFILVLISAGTFFLAAALFENSPETTVQEESVTLELGNGEVRVIEPGNSGEVIGSSGHVVGKQDKNRLTYTASEKENKMAYNTLKVPYGKRFDVVLSDGTTAYLNAGTTLKYPESFSSEGNREVFLTGEAFFEVTENKEHPFIVNTGGLQVKVFGTRFNVSVYPEDRLTDVVLVEGSVGLYEDKTDTVSKTMLTPGHKGSFDRREKRLTIKPVETGVYTSWMNGELVFRNMTFENILRKLERHYNVSISIHNKNLASEEFNASFGSEPVEKVLEYLEITYGIKYTVKKDKIIIE
ncbi:DUF4974 domain-containing protein [Sinomicrobium kalidii]|uniref:FecR family protein n=1 Tax=Sinomicrobium kalidii TaxID=2900738 RepID=UPI001E453DD6|nr:FecR domain-containing protein [Sinomicrobium kalidii]UGU16653.1 DUF4974 domain-containing protein [Sinomicrobium kalidii]